MKLFRHEAIDYQRRRLLGDVIIAQPVHLMLTTALILIMVIFLIVLFLFHGTYSQKESVRGSLTLTSSLAPIQAHVNGVVDKIHVDQGSFIRRGDSLVTIRKKSIYGHVSTGNNQDSDVSVLKSSLSGTVNKVNVHIGDVVTSDQGLVDVRRTNDLLIAELVIPPHLAKAIRIGQSVGIRYDVLGDRNDHDDTGTVERISAGVYMPAQSIGSIRLEEPAYKVSVSLGTQTISAFDRKLHLRQGMMLRAEIADSEQHLSEMLFASNSSP